MSPNEIIDNLTDIIQKCNEYRSQALRNYHRDSAVLRAGQNKMTPEEYRNARYGNMTSYREETKALCLISIAACEAVINQLEDDNSYKAVYKGGEDNAAKQGRKTDAGHGGRDPIR